MTKASTVFAALAAAMAAAVSAAAPTEGERSGAIIRLLNSRAAGSPKSFVEAAEIVAEDAAKGRPLQQYVIALMAEDPMLPQSARIDAETRGRYLDASRGRIRDLAERRGNSLAWYLLSLENNDISMLRKASDGGNVQALNAWGTLSLTRALTDPSATKADIDLAVERSFSCFSRAAAEKDPNGMYNLGMCYIHGYGCEPNPLKALDCFRSAAEAGHAEAINNIGGLYRDGIAVERDLYSAARWFAKSAATGNAYGELNYALALQRGEGVEKNLVRAAELMLASARQGAPEAMNAYAEMLKSGETGAGGDEDARSAIAWFRRAASAGLPAAMENLASCHELGYGGVERSEKIATVWKIRSRAARGDRNAMAWLSQNGYSLR